MSFSPVETERRSATNEIKGNSYLPWYFAFFVISGFCGLVYEVVWVRLAMASFGVTTALVSIVLSIFMAGLGLGSWVAGVAMRGSRGNNVHRSLALYAAVEFLIGCSAILVPLEFTFGRNLILKATGIGGWQSWQYYFLTALWLIIALLPWCTCLGSTYPLLMSVIRQTNPEASQRSFSFLYLANVIGALLGTLASAFVLIELLGFRHTLWSVASLNGLLALIVMGLGRRIRPSTEPISATETKIGLAETSLPRWALASMLFVTGMVSMGSEVVWMRQFTPYLGNFVYGFALIVAIYLLATCLGARDYRRAGMAADPVRSAGIWSLLAFATLLPAFGANPLLPFSAPGLAGLRVIAIFLFCALTGYVTPMLVDSWCKGAPDKAGIAYAFNVCGCIIGPLIASFGLEPWIGERWSLLAFSLPVFVIAGVLSFRSAGEVRPGGVASGKRTSFLVAVAASAILLHFSEDYEALLQSHELYRDYAATVIASGSGFERLLLVNGTGMTILTPITKYISHLPLASLRQRPQNGLVICFGMGTSFRSMLSWDIPTTAVDLIPSVPKTFPYFHADAEQVRASRFASIVIDDGRRFLDGANAKYDVIVVDPPPPVAAPGSSLLYSKQFYEVIKRHLAKEGVFQSWYPRVDGDDASTAAVAKALKESFPYVRAFRSYDNAFGFHFLASMRPLPVETADVLASRVPARAAKDFLEWGPETSVQRQFDLVLSHEVPLQSLIDLDPTVPPVSDDEPINEYFAIRLWLHTAR